MVYRRSRRSRRPRRKYRRTRRYTRRYSRRPRTRRTAATEFPDSKIRVLKWNYIQEIGAGTAGTWNQCQPIRANSFYDPLVAVGGPTPQHYTHYANMFDHYTVISSRLKVRLFPYQGQATVPVCLAMKLDDDGTFTGFSSTWYEMNKDAKVRSKLIQLGPDRMGSISMNFNAFKFFGSKELRESFGAGIASNPTEQAYFLPGYCACNTAAAPPACTVTFTLYMKVKFQEPKDNYAL